MNAMNPEKKIIPSLSALKLIDDHDAFTRLNHQTPGAQR